MRSVRQRLSAMSLTVITILVVGSGAAQADVLGVDTSHWQHPSGQAISWNLLPAQGYKWAVLKATQGLTYTDSSFAADWVAAGNAGLIRGAYDFANPTSRTADAVAEARHFVAVSGPLRARNTLPPVLDLEVTNGLSSSQLVAWTKAWLVEAQRLTGRRPIIYTGLYFWTSAMGNSTAFTGYPLWIAAYRSAAPPPPGGWPASTMWQYTSTGKVNGIAGSVDLDRFQGTATALSRLANGTASIGVNPFGVATVTRTPQGVVVDGWVVDPDTASPATVTVSGIGASKSVVAGLPNSYVGATWPWYGSAHGFHVIMPAVAGVATVTVAATNIGAGVDAQLASKPITVGITPTGTATLVQRPDGLHATGWVVDPDSVSAVTVHLTVDGAVASSGAASLASTAAATAWPGYGTAHGFDVTSAIPVGAHKICLTGDNLGLGSGPSSLSCADVVKYAHPIGALATTTTIPGGVRLAGWALDDTSDSPATIHATVDGTPVAQGTADLPSTTVPPQYAAFGVAHGLSITVPVPAGTHAVCLTADPISPSGVAGQIGCTTVTRSSDPDGRLSGLSLSRSRVAISGWALDPDTADPTFVTMTVDGRLYASAHAMRTSTVAGTTYPGWGVTHGYLVGAYVRAGPHRVCVIGVNLAAGTDAGLGCRTVVASGNPFGAATARVSRGRVTVSGWAADPSTTRPIVVRVYVDGHYTAAVAKYRAGSPDLGVLGASHGFTFSRALTRGSHVIRVYGINVGSGAHVLVRSMVVRA